MTNLNLFIPITKVDQERRLVYGIATAEQVDKSNEIMDYETTKPLYEKWSSEIEKASNGKSLGNLRSMHSAVAAGKLTQLVFNDAAKQIEICAKVVDDAEWQKVDEGVYTGFSQGGRYVKKWKDPNDATLTRYTADPSEVSLVDSPCLGSATFEVVKADGTTELRKFKTAEPEPTPTVVDGKPVQPKFKAVQKWEASDGKTFEKKEDWRVYELELEAKTAGAGALQALADLDKAVTEREQAVNKSEPASADPIEKFKAHVAKAAEDIKKGWSEAYDAKSAIDALLILEGLLSAEEWESLLGEGQQGQIADLKESVSRLKAFIAAEILEESNADKVSKADESDLKKIADENAELQKKIETLEGENANLTKSLNTVNETVEKQVSGLIDRIKKLEDQPLPPKGALFDASNAASPVIKGHEAQKDPAAPVEVSVSPINGASPEQARLFLGITH